MTSLSVNKSAIFHYSSFWGTAPSSVCRLTLGCKYVGKRLINTLDFSKHCFYFSFTFDMQYRNSPIGIFSPRGLYLRAAGWLITDNQCLGIDGVHRSITVITFSYHLADANLFTRLNRYSSFVFHLPREWAAGTLSPVILGRMRNTKFSWENFFQS